MNYDIVIAGAGIIGLTVARQILENQPGAKPLVLEKESSLGVHASGRNSGILHTGIYYPADTLEAKFCKKGADLLFNYALMHKIQIRKDGKVVVACSEENAIGLKKLMLNAEQNGIDALLMNETDIKNVEPYAFAEFGGIYCRDTAVIDSKAALAQFALDIKRHGGKIRYKQQMKSVDDDQKG